MEHLHKPKIGLHECVICLSQCTELIVEGRCKKWYVRQVNSSEGDIQPSPMESMVARESQEAMFNTADWSAELARISDHCAVNLIIICYFAAKATGARLTSAPTFRKMGMNAFDSGTMRVPSGTHVMLKNR